MSEQIWWNKISGASSFINDIIDTVEKNNSVIINNSSIIPFFDSFTDIVQRRLSERSSSKNVAYLNAEDFTSENVVEDMADMYCVGAAYFPKRGYTKFDFLADSDAFRLINSILIVRGIFPGRERAWLDFINGYCNAASAKTHKAQFILIIDSRQNFKMPKQCKSFDFGNYISDYDYYVYCLLTISDNKKYNITMKQYIAEIASLLCRDNAELCWQLLKNPKELYFNTYEYFNSVSPKKMSQNAVSQILWTAQIKYIFPILEKYRCSITKKYEGTLLGYLPFDVKYGDTISEPNNLELGHLLYINSESTFLNYSEYEKVKQYKDIRNELAHMKPTSAENVNDILSK